MTLFSELFETDPALLVRLACAVLPDATLLEAAKEHFIAPRAGQVGRAYAYLSHYLSGRGVDVHFDLVRLLRDCPSVSSLIAERIAVDVRARRRAGSVTIMQSNFQPTSRAAEDWRLALGGFTCEWRFDAEWPGHVVLEVDNRYQFHGRYELTRCVHQAAMDLARAGRARPFRMLGRAVMPWGTGSSGERTESWR